MNKSDKPFVNPRIFWDVDVTSLNFQTHMRMIVERVFERGDVDDIRALRRFYQPGQIDEILVTARHLSPGRLRLASAVLNKPLDAFRCYAQRQLNPELSPY